MTGSQQLAMAAFEEEMIDTQIDLDQAILELGTILRRVEDHRTRFRQIAGQVSGIGSEPPGGKVVRFRAA